jgi:uncharacterized NAD(P)/FAD-binding protein YdhS/predicted metal-dependent enzyme (double-stranded beta helix superfamily)
MEIVKQRLTLNGFIEAIKTTTIEKLELTQLKDWVAKLDLRDIAIEPSICFSCEHYQRQLLHRDSSFEIILVCWKPGQFSPIHTHGDSLNVTRVYRGTLTSRIFADNDLTTEKYFPKLIEEKYLHKDELAQVDRWIIHQLANTSTENLVTFNVYAKPLEQMKVYDSNNKKLELVSVRSNFQKESFKDEIKPLEIKSRNPTVAIAGGGFSGSMVAVNLLKNAATNLNIKLIERRPFVGAGVAYSTNWDCHLLNVPVGKMSAFPDIPDHFFNWLQTRSKDAGKNFSRNDFVARKLYGEYVRSILAEAETHKNANVNWERLTDEAIAIQKNERAATIQFKSGKSLQADRIILALGNFPPRDPVISDPSFYQSKSYLRFGSTPSLLASCSPEESILILGSGLSAIDAILALDWQRHQGKIYVVSRRGLFPQAHQPTTNYPPLFESEPLPKTTLSLLRRIRQEINSATTLGYNWQSAIDSLRPQIQTIWQSLPIAEKQRFLRHLRPYWETHRHRVPNAIDRQIKDKIEAGQLHLFAGQIKAYNEDAEGVNVSIRQRCSKHTHNLRVNRVINCTGAECDYRQLQHPLIENLLSSGLVRQDPLNLGLEVTTNGALIDATGKTSDWLFTLGSPQKGCLWETTAVAEIRQQAFRLTQELIKTLVK